MLRIFLLLIVIVCLTRTAAAQAAKEILPAGTLLQCTLDEPNLSSRTVQVGDPVLCHIGALTAFGRPIFPRGAYLSGRFQEYSDPGRFFGKGWIELAFERLVLPDAVELPLSAKVISVPRFAVDREGKIQGRGHPKRDAVGWTIPALWPVKLVTLPARGPRPTLKGEVRITLRLLGDVEVPVTVISSQNTSSMSRPRRLGPTSAPLENRDGVPAPVGGRVDNVRPSYFLEASSAPQLTWLVLKDGTSYLARDYWLDSGKLQCVTLDWERMLLPLARLDLDETVRLNQERNVEFVLRSSGH